VTVIYGLVILGMKAVFASIKAFNNTASMFEGGNTEDDIQYI